MPQGEFNVERLPRLQFTFEESCTITGVPVSTMELLEKRGQAPVYYKLGRRKFTNHKLLQAWMDRQAALALEEAEADPVEAA